MEPVRSESRPWFSIGPVGRARLEIAGPVFAELEVALLASGIRDRFYVEPSTTVYRPRCLEPRPLFHSAWVFGDQSARPTTLTIEAE